MFAFLLRDPLKESHTFLSGPEIDDILAKFYQNYFYKIEIFFLLYFVWYRFIHIFGL